jgi:hypothetical protein
MLYPRANLMSILEVKCTDKPRVMDAKSVPLKWVVQCFIEMLCWNIHLCVLYVWQNSTEAPDYEIEIIWNDKVAKMLIEEIHLFKSKLDSNEKPLRKTKDKVLMGLLEGSVRILNRPH